MARSTVANNMGNDIPRRTLTANFLTCSPVLHNSKSREISRAIRMRARTRDVISFQSRSKMEHLDARSQELFAQYRMIAAKLKK